MRHEPYDDAFKAEIVARANQTTAYAVSLETGLNYKTVRAWQKHAERKQDLKATIRQHIPPQPTVCSPVIEPLRTRRVLVIPDMHHPFAHPDTLEFLKAVRDAYKTDTVLCLGDEIDAHGMSRYPKDPDGLTAGRELKEAIEHLRPFYREFPEVLVCESNHTMRPWRLSYEVGLPATFLPTVSRVLDAPDGWLWKRFHTIDGVLYTHGDNGKSGQYAAANYMKQAKQSVVIGHIHAYASVFYEGAHFGMNAGCLIDRDAYCFKYAKGALLDVSIGCGVVIEGKQAFFIPMTMDEHRRWTGKL